MHQENWTVAILSSYRHLPKIIGSIDKIFNARAVNANHVSGACLSYNSSANVVNSLIELTERKKVLINLYLLTNEVLKSIDKNQARILIMRFIDNFSINYISEAMSMNPRTVFRKIQSSIESASHSFARLGYDCDKLNEILKNEKWLTSEFKNIDVKNVSKINDKLILNACNKYRKIEMAYSSIS